jgi:hypothetical protein
MATSAELQTRPVQGSEREQLADWSRRIRRLGNAYPRKYRPIVFSIGYHTNIAEGRTFIRVDTIVKESARYTASGKPLQERYVKRLLAELHAAGAIKSEDRWSDDTGRQTSSYRVLDTSIIVERQNGFTRKHDFWAPFEESPQVDEKKDTPQDTPQDTRTVLDLSGNCPMTTTSEKADDVAPTGKSKTQSQNPTPAPREDVSGYADSIGDLAGVFQVYPDGGPLEKLLGKYEAARIDEIVTQENMVGLAALSGKQNVENPEGYFMFLLDRLLATGQEVFVPAYLREWAKQAWEASQDRE